MLFAGCRTKGGHGVAQALLGQCNDVHVALDHHDLVEISVGLPRFVKAVEFLALVEYRGFRRIQVLGLVVAQNATAEGNDPAAAVARSEEHTSELQSLMTNTYAVF